MRVAFIGAVDFSRRLLQALIDCGADIVGVACKPGSTYHADFADVGEVARAAGIPVHHTKSIKSAESVAWLERIRPDVIFCCGWSELLTAGILAIPPLGVVGYHPALLPRNRGRHPIIWALALGLSETGSTFFRMDEGSDSGPILSQRRVAIDPDMDAGALYARLATVAAEQLPGLHDGLRDGSLVPVPQPPDAGTYWRKRSAADGAIDWRMPTRGICNLVRALARPYPGASFTAAGGSFVVWKAADGGDWPADVEPGRVVALAGGAPLIKTGDGVVRLVETDPPCAFAVGDVL